MFVRHPVEVAMVRTDICLCGHPQSDHRTYGCTASRPNPDPKKPYRILCQCKVFQVQKIARAS